MTVNFAVNYLAVIVAAIAAVVIGIVYYGIAGIGDRLARLEGRATLSGGRPSPVQFATGVLVGLVNAWAIAVLAINLGAASIADAILLGVLVWVGFGGTFKAAQVAFEGRSWNAWLLTGVHDVIVQVVVAIVVTLWR